MTCLSTYQPGIRLSGEEVFPLPLYSGSEVWEGSGIKLIKSGFECRDGLNFGLERLYHVTCLNLSTRDTLIR